MTVVHIKWLDHYSGYGWHTPSETTPAGHTNISVGILLSDNGEYTTIAQTMHEDGSQYADLLHILNKQILSYKELN